MNSKPKPSATESARTAALLIAASGGDEAAFDELVLIYRPLLKSSTEKFRGSVNPMDFEELTQEALLSFHRAVKTYDPLYGNVTFGSYARSCINNGLISALRVINRDSRLDIVPLETEGEETDGEEGICDGPDEEYIVRENAEELRRIIRENLSDYENTVFWSNYSGMSAGQIARLTGKSEKSVTNALCRVRAKLRKILTQ